MHTTPASSLLFGMQYKLVTIITLHRETFSEVDFKYTFAFCNPSQVTKDQNRQKFEDLIKKLYLL